MKFRVKCHIFLGLVFVLQLSQTGGKTPEELALFMQKNVEHLIEKILYQVQEYYHEVKLNSKCIPDYVPDDIMETLKNSIDCVSENERKYASGMINQKTHTKNFLNCFSKAKEEVNKTMIAIDPYEDYCPQNMTEKSYEINVTTTFIKTFHINIKNGLEVTHKKIDFSNGNCLNQFSNTFDDKSSQNDHGSDINSDHNSNGNDNDHEDDHDNDEHENDHEFNNDSDEDDANDNVNDQHDNENKHKTVTNNKNKHDSHGDNDNESDNNQDDSDEEDGNSSEEGFTDKYSNGYDNPHYNQKNSSDPYHDKITSLDSSGDIQPKQSHPV